MFKFYQFVQNKYNILGTYSSFLTNDSKHHMDKCNYQLLFWLTANIGNIIIPKNYLFPKPIRLSTLF